VTSRGRRLAALGVVLVTVLFVGRWTAGVLADRWWAESVSSQAARFLVRQHLVRFILEAGGVLLASTWFVTHLCVVARAIGSVQVPRQVANLEIREALTSRVLITTAVITGLVIGLLVGSGTGAWWSPVLLAWNGVAYAETDPLLDHDLGLYVAQLPVWRLLHGYATTLAVIALGTVILLYGVIGSIRWVDRRLAVSDHARAHLGLLLAACAICLTWGYLLRPYEIVAGLDGPVQGSAFPIQLTVAHALAVISLAPGILSAVWASRPKHAQVLGAWVAFLVAAALGRLAPPLLSSPETPEISAALRRRLEGLAYGLNSLKDTAYHAPAGRPVLPVPAALWPPQLVVRVAGPESTRVLSVDRAVIPIGGRPRPVWLVLRSEPAGRTTLGAIADDRTGVLGGALAYQEADTFGSLQPVSRLELSPRAVRPGGPEYVLDTTGRGVESGTWPRRVALAWSLQAIELFHDLPPGARVFWNLAPRERLAQLVPFAEWDVPLPRLVGGELYWVVDGYLTSNTFPVADQVPWRNRVVNSIHAAFVGIIRAESGETRIYLRRTADPLADRWAGVAGGLIQPASALPAELQREVWYPEALFRAQATILQGSHWKVGHLVGAAAGGPEEVARPEHVWESDTLGAHLLAPYEEPEPRRIVAVLSGRMTDGWETLSLFRLDSAQALPSPVALQNRWSRFPSFAQIRDSVRENGGEWLEGPVRYWVGATGLGAYQPAFGISPNGDPSLVWVSLAIGDRMGAGRTLLDAYRNLLGISSPVIATGSPASQIEEARRWLALADSSLRAGDFVAFGRAFEALKRILQGGGPRHK